MTPDDVEATYRRALGNFETIQIRRMTPGVGAGFVDYDCLARPREFGPDELVGIIQQGDLQVIALRSDLVAAGFPMPVREADFVRIGGQSFALRKVDGNSRRLGGVTIAYEMIARGA